MTDPAPDDEMFETRARRDEKAEARLADCLAVASGSISSRDLNVRNSQFLPSDRLPLLARIGRPDGVCLVGGQSVGLWAAVLDPSGEFLARHMPFTTSDIDYFGDLAAARRFSESVGGTLFRPSADTMNSNSTALVRAPVGQETMTVDFLHAIIGVERREIEKGTLELDIPDGSGNSVAIPVLHPILVMRSRIANMLSAATMRRDAISYNQARAAIGIVRLWADRCIAVGDHGEAMKTITACVSHATVDRYGKRAMGDLGIDQLDAVRDFQQDLRLDGRWRMMTLAPRIAECENRRARATLRG